MKVIRKILSYLLGFVLALLIIVQTILVCTYNNVLNEVNIQIQLKNTSYYYNIYSIIENTAKDFVMQSGFNEIVLDGVITESRVQNDLNSVINCVYNNKKIEINTNEMKEILHKNIKKQIEIKNYEVDKQTQIEINEFEESIIKEYKANMFYSEDVINVIAKYLQKVRQMVLIAIIVMFIIIAVLGFIVFKLNKPTLGISFIIAGLFSIILKICSGVGVAINNILLLNWAFSKTLVYIINNIVKQIYTTGIILTILGVAIIIYYEYEINKKIYKNKKKIRDNDGE